MNVKITTKHLLILLIFYSATALIIAYIAEFKFGYQPCILCLHERKLFFAIIALAALTLILFKSEKSQKIAFFFCIFFLLINVGITIYHVGVEQKIFAAPSACSSENLNNFKNLEDLRIALMKTKAVRCDEPSLFFLGLSMAVWNLIYCTGLIFLNLLLVRNAFANTTRAIH